MDIEIRDLHQELHPAPRRPPQEWRKGEVVAAYAGPPRTADITEGASASTLLGIPLAGCCPTLAPGDDIWLLRTGDLRVIFTNEA